MRVLLDGGIGLLGSSAGVHTGRSRWAFALAGVRARRSLRAFAMMIDGDYCDASSFFFFGGSVADGPRHQLAVLVRKFGHKGST